MGPHGLVIGATGSGKSEFLRTLVLGLAMTHSPEHLNMVLVDFKGGATFAGHVRAAARLRGDHQPRPGAHPRRPHAGRAVRRDGAPPGAAPRGRQLRLDPRLREGPRGRRGPRSRCRRCSSWSTSSPRCWPPSRSSSTCSSPSAGSAARSACTCCSPRSGSRRAGCAASSRTCPTGSGCGPSAPRSRARCSAYPTPTSCRRSPAWPTSSPTRPRCCGSRPPTSPARRPAGCAYAATRAASCRGSCRSRSPRCRSSTSRSTSRSPSRCPVETGDQQSLLDLAVDHMVGHGPAAHQVWLPPLDVPDTLDELMPDLAVDPRARAGLAASGGALGGLVVPLGTVDRPREQRRDTLSRRPQRRAPATSPSSAARAAARARCCARWWRAWR